MADKSHERTQVVAWKNIDPKIYYAERLGVDVVIIFIFLSAKLADG